MRCGCSRRKPGRRYFCVSSGGSVRRLSASGYGTVRRNLCGLLGNGFGGNAGSVSDLYPENPYGKRDCSGDDWNRIWKRSGRIIVFLEEVVMTWREKQQQSYENYVRQKTPVHNLPVNMAKAFVTGGIICVIGQGILNICEKAGLGRDMSGSWCSMLLVLLSAVLTGCNLYPQIAKWGGAGALVPITGFANSVAAPAIEYKKEGQVIGIGCKIFTIAGPVILYGIFTSWLLGLFYGC